ncbi:MAG: VWA domain-containing protein [Planctomycetes bacterium]|nr:VWA domain-containing protein [Planctomycetota bacterium]
MRFLHPAHLVWALLIAVPVVLYLFRRKPRTVRVSTLLFFKSLAREHRESEWLRRLKRLLSLLLNILAILAVVAALARPVVSPRAGSLRSVVVLIDRSASMAAADGRGVSRLDAAKAILGERLAGLPGGVAVMAIAYDCRPDILQPFTLDRREIARALAAVEVRPIEGDPDAAVCLAARLAALDPPAAIWHATDGLPGEGSGERSEGRREKGEESGARSEGRGAQGEERTGEGHPTPYSPRPTPYSRRSAPHAPLPPDVSLETLCVPLERPVNAGITAFQMRRLPMQPSRFEAFVQVHAVAPGPLEAALDVRVDGRLTATRKLTLGPRPPSPAPRSSPDAPRPSPFAERLLIPVTAGEGAVLSIVVAAPGDALPLDDAVHARVPELRPVRVLWVAKDPDPFTELALRSLGAEGEIQVFQGGPAAWPPKEPPDVAVFDGWLPEAWPEGVAVVAVNPPRACGPLQVAPIRGGVPVESVRVAAERHPLLYGVASGRVALTQAQAVASDGPLQPLWVGPSGPLLAAGEARGQRIVVMAFAPKNCEHLPLMASYPILVGNAIYWSVQPAMAAHGGNSRKTGELIATDGSPVTWSVPAAGGLRQEAAPVRGRWAELDRVGLWQTGGGEAGSAALLAERESLLPARESEEREAEGEGRIGKERPTSRSPSLLSGDLTALFLWCLLALLVLECWLFHRHAVY